MKVLQNLFIVASISSLPVHGAITYVNTFDMGEAGSLGANNRPQDGTGSASYGAGVGGALVTTGSAPGSSAHLSYNGSNQGNWNGDFSALATDNFAVELWLRTSNLTQGGITVFQTGNSSNGNLKIGINGGVWTASYHNLSWIGATGGAGQTVTSGAWTHLAVIRDNGTSTLYIDGVAQAQTSGSTPVHQSGAHLAVNPGGAAGAWFDGDIDEINTFTFVSGVDDPVAALSINAIPEPSSTALLGLGGLVLTLRRRK